MKGKEIFKRIVVVTLMFAVICSNIPVFAGSSSNEDLSIAAEAEDTSEETQAAAVVSDEPAEDIASSEAAEGASAENTEGADSSNVQPGPAEDPSAGDSGQEDPAPSPAEEEKPDAEASQGQPEDPEQPENPGQTEQPEDSEQTAETKPEYKEEEPLDFSNQISIEEMSRIPDVDGTAATVWPRSTFCMLTALYNVEPDETDEEKAWTFDAYYVNQNDPYYVAKTSDFNLKYQMEFHASQDLAAGAVLIRIDAELCTDRNGNIILPTEIAVPEGNLEKSVSNRTTPFNYYIEETGDGTPEYLVFFNYRKIPSGTNAAWQVLYKNQKLMNIKDETAWELKPQISVDTRAKAPSEDVEEIKARTYAEAVEKGMFEDRTPLTGKVDSSVTLTSVTKTAYHEAGRNYTPGLYTKSQVEKYINGSVPGTYLTEEGRLNTSDWRFVVWDVRIQGSATQPWSLSVQDLPTLGGGNDGMRIVGYRDNSNPSSAYRLAVDAPSGINGNPGEETELLPKVGSGEAMTNESWGNRFYVVTAYPAARVSSGTVVQNQITVILNAWDNPNDTVVLGSAPATWNYADYDWHFTGDKIGITKKNGIGTTKDETRYTGWLDAYRRSSEQGADYGEIPYSTTSVMHGYSDTHYTVNKDGHTTGEYKPGTYYTFTTADDFLYLHTGDNIDAKGFLTADDYYFSDVMITQTDQGYDVWEDEKKDYSELRDLDGDELPDVFKDEDENIRSEVRIYAMLANLGNKYETDDQGWTQIYIGQMDPGTGRFTGSLNELLGDDWCRTYQPYRIKVEHDSIDFESVCKIDVKVCLKAVSKKKEETAGRQLMNKVLEACKGQSRTQKSPVIYLENLSSAVCQAYQVTNGEAASKEVTASYTLQGDDINKDGKNYKDRPDLIVETKKLYPGFGYSDTSLPIRGSAVRELTWLTETAEANKEAKITNDVNNNRVQVEYYLTAYDGYEIYDRNCLDYLKEEGQDLISPGRSHVVFYDLLPYGMQYDASVAPTAGRITELDSKGYYRTRPGNWSRTQVQVVVDPEKDIIPDYRGTGRTMVAFHVIYTGADSTSYTASKWIEGWGVSFHAYYDWKDISQINDNYINSNLCAFMPDFSEIAGGSNDDHPSLCGLEGEVYHDNGKGIEDNSSYADMVTPDPDDPNKVSGNIDGISQITTKDAEGNDITKEIDKDYRTVIYANHVLRDDVATASSSKIETLVHADADTLGAFAPTATVPVSEERPAGSLLNLYTYDHTVTVNSPATNVVIFNRLEMAATDRQKCNDPFDPFEENPWSGTFRGIDTSGLDKQGITGYTVYYNAGSDVTIPEGAEDPATILTEEKGWYTAENFKVEYSSGWQEKVKAVAVDLGTYEVPANGSVSFRIKMTAPMPEEGKSIYTYNNASFSSKAKNDDTRSTVAGNSVRVTIGKPGTLEVVKKTSGAVPSALEDERFEFRIYEEYKYEGVDTQKGLAYTQYRLYKWNSRDSKWEEEKTQAYATDGNGYFYLHADEMAVFEAANIKELKVQETESVFWESRIEDKTTKVVDGRRIGAADGDIRTRTVTNVYRPVLYVQKSLMSVPADVKLTEAEQTFTFQIQAGGKALAEARYWVVDDVRLDGGIPRKLRDGKTNADGTFSIRDGEIIALFPGVAGTQYELSEVLLEDTADSRWSWHCENNTLTGKLPSGGDSRTITNYYRWKDLLLKKEITHQTKEEYDAGGQVFTFRLSEAVLDENGDPLTDTEGIPIAKKRDDNNTYTTKGLKWVLLDEDGEADKPNESSEPPAEDPGSAESNTIGADGTFSCRAGYRTVKIKGLEAGKIYFLDELTDGITLESVSGKPLYVPNNDTLEVKMPIYSSKKDVTITNDYQMRSLSVTKTVVGTGGSGSSTGSEITDTDIPDSDFEGTGENDASAGIIVLGDSDIGAGSSDSGQQYRFTLRIIRMKKEGGTQTITPDADTSYVVTKSGVPDDTRPFEEGGTFVLHDGETAVFKNIGMLGDRYIVDEIDDEEQIYPPVQDDETKGVAEGILSGDGNEETFINGTPGSLMLSKVYTGLSEDGKAEELISAWKDHMQRGNNGTGDLPDWYVSFILKMTEDGEPVDKIQATAVSQLNPENRHNIEIKYGMPFSVKPWETIVINTEDYENAVYTLEEVTEDRIVNYTTRSADGEKIVNYMQISQSAESKTLASPKSVTERPMATVYNEVSTLPNFSGRKISKSMTAVSDRVPLGARLVWRVEKYDSDTGRWSPADGIPYAVFNNRDEPVSGQIEKTRDGGKIILSALGSDPSGDLYPAVWFQEDTVYVNLYKADDIDRLLTGVSDGKSLLRVVEVPEESDEGWGLLAGYTYLPQAEQEVLPQAPNKGKAISRMVVQHNVTAIEKPYSMDVSPDKADGFMNSNVSDTLEIEKKMSENSDKKFTMILKQVLSTSTGMSEDDVPNPIMSESDIIASRSASGIPYTVIKADGTRRSGTTGPNGEIELYAGERAVLNVPEGTMWTVTEQTFLTPTYKLADLAPENGTDSRLTKLNDNLMLINLPASQKYTLTFNDNGGFGGPGTLVQVYKQAPEGGVTFTIPGTEPKREGYQFLGWSKQKSGNAGSPQSTEGMYQPGAEVTLPEGKNNLTLYAQWVEQVTLTYSDKFLNKMTVEYYDKGASVEVQGDPLGERTGYIFKGWDTSAAADTAVYGEYDFFTINANTTLYAVWEPETYTVIYTDGVNGETVFSDQSYGGMEAGDSTPAFDGGSPSRNGYTFMDWAPAWKDTVDPGMADKDHKIIYTATWNKISANN